MKTSEITDEQGEAIIRIIDALPLIEQILVYRKPGEYQFRQMFPEEYARLTWDAALLKESRVPVVNRFGYLTGKLAQVITETDRIHGEFALGSRPSRKQIKAQVKTVDKFERAYHALVKEVTR